MYTQRTYRNHIHTSGLKTFRVRVKETDLFVSAVKDLSEIAREMIFQYRGIIEKFIQYHPEFLEAFTPLTYHQPTPEIIANMLEAAHQAGVGPMAAVAGAIAEHVGLELLPYSDDLIIENGGDIFIKSHRPVTIGIFAGRSPLSMKIGLRLEPQPEPVAVCTSSGTVGHSASLGKADAVCVLSASCTLADAAATSIGNRVQQKTDIPDAIEFGKHINKVDGLVIIKNDKIGLWGELNIVPLMEKKVEF